MSLYDDIAASEIIILTAENGEINATFCFSKALDLFKGHFPGKPILPGIVQFEMVKYAIEKSLNLDLCVKSIKKSKFSSKIFPDQKIDLTIKFFRENKNFDVKAVVKTDEKTAGKLNMVISEL